MDGRRCPRGTQFPLVRRRSRGGEVPLYLLGYKFQSDHFKYIRHAVWDIGNYSGMQRWTEMGSDVHHPGHLMTRLTLVNRPGPAAARLYRNRLQENA